jgi:hypothetical protein
MCRDPAGTLHREAGAKELIAPANFARVAD